MNNIPNEKNQREHFNHIKMADGHSSREISSTSCPNVKTLQRLALGKLGTKSSSRMLSHLIDCAECARDYRGLLEAELIRSEMSESQTQIPLTYLKPFRLALGTAGVLLLCCAVVYAGWMRSENAANNSKAIKAEARAALAEKRANQATTGAVSVAKERDSWSARYHELIPKLYKLSHHPAQSGGGNTKIQKKPYEQTYVKEHDTLIVPNIDANMNIDAVLGKKPTKIVIVARGGGGSSAPLDQNVHLTPRDEPVIGPIPAFKWTGVPENQLVDADLTDSKDRLIARRVGIKGNMWIPREGDRSEDADRGVRFTRSGIVLKAGEWYHWQLRSSKDAKTLGSAWFLPVTSGAAKTYGARIDIELARKFVRDKQPNEARRLLLAIPKTSLYYRYAQEVLRWIRESDINSIHPDSNLEKTTEMPECSSPVEY